MLVSVEIRKLNKYKIYIELMILQIGCCGFPRKKNEYYNYFKIVEIQNVFYKFPKPNTLHNWRVRAPNDFEFVVKASQLITHIPSSPTYRKAKLIVSDPDKYGYFKSTLEVFNAWERTKQACEILSSKCCIFQTPSSFKPTNENIKNMYNFFSSINRDKLYLGWEPRGQDWTTTIVEKIVKDLDLIYVYDPFAHPIDYESPVFYFRLHGSPPGKKMYYYNYSEKDLLWLLSYINTLRENKPDTMVYVLFNNGIYSWDSAIHFLDIVKSSI